MTWNYDRSSNRIKAHLDAMGEITVTKLRREADLNELLSETQCRQIYGAHAYIQISNFARLASVIDPETDAYRELVRAVHVYQRELGRLVALDDINGLRVHFQGTKLHTLFYRPIDDGSELAKRAVCLQLIVRDFVSTVFNEAVTEFDDFQVAGGIDLGNAIGTRNGARNDRELLFLGAPANYAAKILGSADRIRLTHAVFIALPELLQDLCEIDADDYYSIPTLDTETLDALLDDLDVAWDRERSRQHVADDLDQFDLDDISVSGAKTAIDLDLLSISNNKLVQAASIFADVSGFTAYVDAASTEDEQKGALRAFHAIRREMARVVRHDFAGLRVQYQGDRMQGLFHLPENDDKSIVEDVVAAAIGLQSSMEITLKEQLPEASTLRLAIGINLGQTLVSKLGTRAHRDRICLGSAVESAAVLEERCSGGVIGVSSVVYGTLSSELQDHFTWDRTSQCYTATDLTVERVEANRKAAAYQQRHVHVTSTGAGISVAAHPQPHSRPVTPPKPWGERDCGEHCGPQG